MRPERKKLLIATVGVAAVNYWGCQPSPTSGNFGYDAVDAGDASACVSLSAPCGDASVDAAPDQFIVSGNLAGPIDSGIDAPVDAAHDASDAANAGD